MRLYADDTQLYLLFDTNAVAGDTERVKACVQDIRQWMVTNKLRLVVLLMTSPVQRGTPDIIQLTTCDTCIRTSGKVSSLGVVFDQHLDIEGHINTSVWRAISVTSIWRPTLVLLAALHCSISATKKPTTTVVVGFLSRLGHYSRCPWHQVSTAIAQALIVSPLDICSSLLFGSAGCSWMGWGVCRNVAARVVSMQSCMDWPHTLQHLCPINSHWMQELSTPCGKFLLDGIGCGWYLTLDYLTQFLGSVVSCIQLADASYWLDLNHQESIE